MLTKVSLINFRNYTEAGANVGADLVLILGPNASGKTNFLESIYYLSRLKSFRAPDNLLVKSQEDYFKIEAVYDSRKLEIITQLMPRVARQYKIDEQKIRKLNWKTFSTVLFVPQDLNMFDLGPSLRRKFLNQTLSQINMEYALDIVTLEHVLKQKSALFGQILEGRAQRSDLEIWNQELARVSISINRARKQFTQFLNNSLNQVYADLSDFQSHLFIVYKGIEAETTDEFLEKLAKYHEAEIRSGQNLYGPHRDDFIVEKDGKENIYNSSRGELRAQILALKLLQAKYLDAHKHKTIILLDDVFSELDETRRSKLISSLSGHQIFITTTEEHHLPKFEGDIKILNIESDQIKTAK
ncbi:MAG: DNA replication and repair protein RecF [Candidatus Doudnabacteria bacterium]|nr:DNA replication and repair protein RecF [Candidatus Doudnabacteria bacterium]